MLARGARRDGEELVEGQNSRFTARPAWKNVVVSATIQPPRVLGGVEVGELIPFWPS
jgi:hypothetical protein